MVDSAEVGKYGTIRLMKFREPASPITSYPIDDEEVSFGRDPNCSVRLYYPWVSSLHCKIIFEDRKAFLQVFGANGLILDGCQVYPAKAPTNNPMTIPLVNGSSFEIHKKRFQFNYPPKELRPQLFTPLADRRRSLRMSMIQSADVFSPRPSENPRENLRVLQSPLKQLSFEGEPEMVKLVDGDHPRVVEEEQDLIILEDVEHAAPSPTTTPSRSATVPSMVLKPLQPKTPRRRSVPSLHRVVLLRSAHRIAQLHELQTHQQDIGTRHGDGFNEVRLDEDESKEEEEVEEAVSAELVAPDESEEDMADADDDKSQLFMDGIEHATQHRDEDGDGDGDDEQDITEARDDYQEQDVNAPNATAPEHYSTPLQIGRVRQLGAFMTPQPSLFAQRPKADGKSESGRTGPQRPPPGARFSLAPGLGGGTMSLLHPGSNEEKSENGNVARSGTPVRPKAEITESERRAILERRKSAIKAPEPDFEHIPGLGGRRTSALPPPLAPSSPFKSIREDIDEGEDTKSVLKRMEESLEGMRRKSMTGVGLGRPNFGIGRGKGLSPSPTKVGTGFSLLAPSPSPERIPLGMRSFKSMKDLEYEETGRQHGLSEVAEMESEKDDAVADALEGNEDEPVRGRCHVPKSPRMDGLRELFHAPRPVAGLATPVVKGVRELFRVPDKERGTLSQTPRMEGMRELFREEKKALTPMYDGIEEMMAVEGSDEGTQDDGDEGEEIKPTRTSRAPSQILKTVVRGGAARVVRATPTDSSNMADDEATPDSMTGPAPKRRGAARSVKASDGVPEAAVVHRTGRVRKATGADSNVEESVGIKASATRSKNPEKVVDDVSSKETEILTKARARRGRPPKAMTVSEAESNGFEQSSVADSSTDGLPKAKQKGRPRKANPAEMEVEVGMQTDVGAKPSRRGANLKKVSTDDESSAPSKPTRRGTRARSKSVDPEIESNDDPVSSIDRGSPERTTAKGRRAVRGKATIDVETIVEEDELLQKKTPATKSRKVKEYETGHDEASTKLKSKTTKRKATKATHNSVDEDMDRGDKENTPDPSPISPAESAEEPLVRVKSKATVRAVKPASKTSVKVKSEDEPVAVPRTTRTRARK